MDGDLDEAILKLERIADRRIREAQDAGAFDNLEGYGKPLNTADDNPHVPAEMRAALKVLSNSGYAPDWMVLAQEIEVDLEKMRQAADRHFAYLRRSLQEIAGDPYAVKRLRTEIQRLRANHRRASAQHSKSIEEINRKINSFNQMVPIASLMRIPLSLTAEMEKYEDRVPAFLSYG
jgi:hypothetical protein